MCRDYVRLIKYADSLYRCKSLKIAALGRMMTLIKRQKAALAYLEEVRKHLGRLPALDPTARTLLVCGFPNVGKSSFVNKVTRADVEVQPWAFTTKALFGAVRRLLPDARRGALRLGARRGARVRRRATSTRVGTSATWTTATCGGRSWTRRASWTTN